ncbi:extracellular solute-binding protein [Corynebacterium timonense]|uniref:Carbohydrate ABC transporter substrate-binding protein, CUT1 family n=1 Tax=Corynebacterium timonense TaxID=441500 RepID=A0A1H1VHT2_9CORY|nr:extracellular solute-binding protein [Corynebacterium timonense]SDS84303.1 carbohydrate ABC transporter substrate-binding protein, CUT1 family [Corynebacterium timonense]
MAKTMGALCSVAALGLVLAACANEEDSQANGQADAQEEIQIEFWHSTAGNAGETLQALVDEFNDEHDGAIEILPLYQGNYADSIAKFISSVQTGDLPALYQANEAQVSYLIDSGLAVPAEELSERSGAYDFDNLLPAVRSYYTVDGTIHSMPAMVSQPTVFVNKDLLDEAGVELEQLQTVSGLLDATEAIHAATGIPGTTFHHNAWYVEIFNSALGNETCSPDNGVGAEPATEFNIANDELVAMLDRFGEFYATGALHNPGADGQAATGAFQTGNVATQLVTSSALSGVEEAAKDFEFVLSPWPQETEDAGAVIGGNSLWAIQEGHSEEVQNAAWEFMKFMGSDDVQERLFLETGYLPTTQRSIESLDGLNPRQETLLAQLRDTPETVVTAGCHTGALNTARAEYQLALANIAGGADAAQELATAEEAATRAIADYESRSGR